MDKFSLALQSILTVVGTVTVVVLVFEGFSEWLHQRNFRRRLKRPFNPDK